jgi:ATP-binding protein involved in chromosome partitioning
MAGGVIKQFLTQVEWGELDYLIIDYPPGTGDVQLTISQTAPVTGAVIVTTPQEVALLDVRKAIAMFKATKIPILGVIETMSYFICDGCDKKHFIFRAGGGEKLAREHGIAFLGGVPIDPSVVTGSDEGRPQVLTLPQSPSAIAYNEAAGSVARQVSILNAQNDGALNYFTLEWKS